MKLNLESLVGGEVKGKIFRIYRDVRFSQDKTPYNPYLRMSFSHNYGSRDCSAGPSFFLSLEPDQLILGCGMFEFAKETLSLYREAVVSDKQGVKLSVILSQLQEYGLEVSEPEYKRVPHGYDKNHARASLLRHKGLAIWNDHESPEILSTPNAISFCLAQYQQMQPLYDWLTDLCASN